MALAASAVAPVSAQVVLREDFGPADRGWFGAAVAAAGDVDDDGHPDLVVGAYFEDSGLGPAQGAAYVISGADGRVLHRIAGSFVNGRFGTAVAGIGDADGDGHDDFAVSATLEPDGFGGLQGVVRAYSGASGALLAQVARASAENFGLTQAAAGDLDGDGLGDLLVGAPTANFGGGAEGAVFAYSGRAGRLLHQKAGATAGRVSARASPGPATSTPTPTARTTSPSAHRGTALRKSGACRCTRGRPAGCCTNSSASTAPSSALRSRPPATSTATATPTW
ncbi:MAG TPA: hypothetical protein VGC54_08490 [Planctomycetota bacterium]